MKPIGWKMVWVLVLGSLWIGRPAGASPPTSLPLAGSTAPTFMLPEEDGRLVRLEDYQGQTVVLNFWAFWCDTWKAELPSLKVLARQQASLHFHLVAISVDGTRLPVFQKYTHGVPVPFPVLLDAGGHVSKSYHVAHVPTVVIVDGTGHIRYTAYGYPGNEAVLNALRRITR